MSRTILVTGSLGYLGSRLTHYLSDAGFRCRGYDTGFFRDCTLYPAQDPDTTMKDVRDLSERDLEGVDAVVHLAGISNDPFGSLKPEEIYDPTRAFSGHLAMHCKQMGIRFIFASSCSVYGIGGDRLVTEQSRTFPQTPYSRNKLQIEQDLVSLAAQDFSPIILRFATIFGISPRIRFDIVINMFVGMALTTGRILLNSNGQAWRPHVHIEDACEAILRCLTLQVPAGQPLVLNVGDTQQNLRIVDVAELVRRCVPRCQVEFLHGDGRPTTPKALQELAQDRKIQDGEIGRAHV